VPRVAQKIRLEDRECPLSATLGLVGEWWTLLILHDAFDGYSRFDQFQENLGISSSLLTSRLKRMVGAGLLERRQYQANPARYEYLLTELGRSLRPVVVVLAAEPRARSLCPLPVWVDGIGWSTESPSLSTRTWGRAEYARRAAERGLRRNGEHRPRGLARAATRAGSRSRRVFPGRRGDGGDSNHRSQPSCGAYAGWVAGERRAAAAL